MPPGTDLFLGRRAEQLDPKEKWIRDDRGDPYNYDKLLLATGSTPRRLPFGGDRIIYFRTVNDYRELRALSDARGRIAVIGGGFIGSEIAAVLAMQGNQVTLIFPEEAIGHTVFPADLSRFLNDYYQEKGVEVLAGTSATGVTGSGADLALQLDDGRSIPTGGIVAGIGVTPNVALAEAAGLEVENGIRVNIWLQTSNPDIYAVGDVANFKDTVLGVRRRVEHEDAALSMGKAAAASMTGSPLPYDHSPYFYSDLFELGYEAVGEVDSRLETVADWQEPYRKGVVYYLKGDRLRGVLLWNVWDKVAAARELIAADAPVDRARLTGAL
jgi:NADPH-dependent 2,4-dienoyl-CoA reductase/sulfur reductase-like enzyme